MSTRKGRSSQRLKHLLKGRGIYGFSWERKKQVFRSLYIALKYEPQTFLRERKRGRHWFDLVSDTRGLWLSQAQCERAIQEFWSLHAVAIKCFEDIRNITRIIVRLKQRLFSIYLEKLTGYFGCS